MLGPDWSCAPPGVLDILDDPDDEIEGQAGDDMGSSMVFSTRKLGFLDYNVSLAFGGGFASHGTKTTFVTSLCFIAWLLHLLAFSRAGWLERNQEDHDWKVARKWIAMRHFKEADILKAQMNTAGATLEQFKEEWEGLGANLKEAVTAKVNRVQKKAQTGVALATDLMRPLLGSPRTSGLGDEGELE